MGNTQNAAASSRADVPGKPSSEPPSSSTGRSLEKKKEEDSAVQSGRCAHEFGYDSTDLMPGRWGVVKRKAVLSWDARKPMPEFRQVVTDGGIMWLDLSESELLLGGRLENVFIVSHRWSVSTFCTYIHHHTYTRTRLLFASCSSHLHHLLAAACLLAFLMLTYPRPPPIPPGPYTPCLLIPIDRL